MVAVEVAFELAYPVGVDVETYGLVSLLEGDGYLEAGVSKAHD